MFERKIVLGQQLDGDDRRELRRAYRGNRTDRVGTFRLLLLLVVAIAAVLLMSHGIMELWNGTGDELVASL